MRVLVATAAVLASIHFAAPARAQSFVERHGALRIEGNKVVDSHGKPITLRGMALYWSQWEPGVYNAQVVRWLRDDWKCTVIRASIAVGYGGYLTNPTAEMNKLRTVVRAAIDAGIYVIIDFHETDNGNDHLTQARRFFDDVSKEFGSYPNVIYETWNEPLNTHPWATVIKPYHEAVIPVIRANDTDNIILCGTKTWSQDVDEASRNPITISKNIAYTLHFYAGTHKESLRAKARTALANGIALMVTEGGMSQASGDEGIYPEEMQLWCDFLDENGILWTNWSVTDVDESSAALKPGTSLTGGWNESQLTPSGTWVRNRLRSKSPPVSIGRLRPNPFTTPAAATGVLEAFRDARGRLVLEGREAKPGADGVYFIPTAR
jgi:endoglucanase